ncbi:MAG: hypothetical protein AAGK01_07630 [Pseudomonadota bacterium]
MKLKPIVAAFALSAVFVSPAMAQKDAAGSEAKAAKFTIDTPIESLVANAKAKAVLDKHIPGIAQHPAYGQFKTMSLKAVQPFSQGAITPEMLANIQKDLAEIA